MGEFKDFVLRGNVVELAIAVVMGTAFSAIVTAIVTGLVTPLIGVIGSGNLATAHSEVNGADFLWGSVIDAALRFVIISAIIFFFVLKPMNHLLAMRKTEVEVADATKQCTECLSSIPARARRCAFCTSEQPLTVS